MKPHQLARGRHSLRQTFLSGFIKISQVTHCGDWPWVRTTEPSCPATPLALVNSANKADGKHARHAARSSVTVYACLRSATGSILRDRLQQYGMILCYWQLISSTAGYGENAGPETQDVAVTLSTLAVKINVAYCSFFGPPSSGADPVGVARGEWRRLGPRSSAKDTKIEAPKAPREVGVWRGVPSPPHRGGVCALPRIFFSILELKKAIFGAFWDW